MAVGNKEVTDLTLVPDPANADVYCAKAGVDYRIRSGVAGGLATLGGDGKLTAAQVPVITTVTWDSLSGKPVTFTPSAHVHDASDIVTGLLSIARGGTGTNVYTGTGSNVYSESPVLNNPSLTGNPTASNITLGGGKKLTKITLSNVPPGTLADGELYLKY